MNIVEATNVCRVVAANALPLDTPFTSKVIDFKNMPMGSIQFLWEGADTLDGTFKIYASNFPTEVSFDPEGTEIDGAEIIIHNETGSRIWIRDRLAFRYALIRYTPNTTTTGTVTIAAIGKRT